MNDRHDRDERSGQASRRSFVSGAIALGLSAATAEALASRVMAQTPAASPASGELDVLALAGDTVNGTFPLVEETATLRVMIPSSVDVASFEDNDFTRWYEEKTNVHIEWDVVPGDEEATALNVRLASGDYAEILMGFDQETSTLQLYGADGTYQALNTYIDQHAVEFKRVLEQYPLTSRVITSPDGNIYALPYVNDCFHCAQDRKLWIYKPWLDELGLAMPETTEDYANALRAFKERDPNCFPLSTCASGGWNSELDLNLMNAFVFNPGTPWLTLVDGKVTATYTTDGWKQGTAWLASLYAEGLIDPESFTQDAQGLQAKANREEGTLVGSAPGGSWGVFVQWVPGDASQRWAEYALMPPLKGPDGVQIAPFDPYLPYDPGAFIVTDACDNPELAVRWADGLYDLEATMRAVSGVPDVGWRWAKQGELGRDGEQGIWVGIPRPASTTPGSDTWGQRGPSYRSGRVRNGEVLATEELREYDLDNLTSTILRPFKQPDDWVIPPLYLSTEDAQTIAEVETTILPFVTQTFAQAVTGQADIESVWDSYTSQLDAMGLARYLEIMQNAVDQQHDATSTATPAG
ncbi:MAG: extracellular solute-binding protein [Thermomicrobiales bacterium]